MSPHTEWRSYLGDTASNQYSPLASINRDNVEQLEEAWRYDPGDADDYGTLIPTNPLIVNGILYGLSARKNLFALDASNGKELWVYPFDQPHIGKGSGRGLVYWQGRSQTGEKTAWILVGLGHELFAVDALRGTRVEEFGDGGVVDLRKGLDRPIDEVNLSVIAPGTLYGNLLIQGFGTSEFYDAAPGYIRAYHLPTGDLRWTFRTIPRAGDYGADSWPDKNRSQFGGANSWAGITVDEQRGIAYVPTGSAAYDYYGANRLGDNLFANSLVALDASTGQRLWHYQIVRHDLWDRDLPTPPNLVTITRDGERIPAVSQATKSGHLFLFHRDTGEPLFPIEEIRVTGSGAPGNQPADTQPLPTLPPPFANQQFEVSQVRTQSTAYISTLIEGMATNQPFHAPDEQGLVMFPGLDGGAQWGGQAYDASSDLLFINTNEVPWYFRMVPHTTGKGTPYSIEFAYLHYCGGCHGADRQGNGDIFPSLQNIGDRFWPWQVWDIIRHGRGRMPAFANEPWYFMLGPLLYLYAAGDNEIAERSASGEVAGYLTDGFNTLTDEYGLPGSRPPWGSLVAVDLNRARLAWKVPLGDYPQARDLGLSGLGAENYGGPVVTAGGLVFIGATPDQKFRAFDKNSGALLWETDLPAAGFATPAVYQASGKQFVVIAAGGGKLGQPSGSAYVAYALPQTEGSTPSP
ncbi:MAG: PQQ-binding-like beta-propeller repeat protein [Halioglobus sp.]|nr:PQQ-binding-like beta-propeller repeat protein [Halioglobus sp.]